MQNQTVSLCDINDDEESIDESEFVEIKLISSQVKVKISQLFKYSKIFRENYQDIYFLPSLSHKLQIYQTKFNINDQNAILFFRLIHDEEVVISNEIYFDLYKLSEFFNATKLTNFLNKYSKNNFNDLSYIIQKIRVSIQGYDDDSNDQDNFIIEMEQKLVDRINECFTNPYFGDLPVSIIYRMISKCNIQTLSMDLLFDFISNSINTRFSLLNFLDLQKLPESKFDELYEKYIESGKSYIYQHLPNNLDYINNLKNGNKAFLQQVNSQQAYIRQLEAENSQIRNQLASVEVQKGQLERKNRLLQEKLDILTAKCQNELVLSESLCKSFIAMFGSESERNMKESVQFLEYSSNKGSGYASYILGLLYENGVTVGKDFNKAALFYLKSDEQGISHGLNRLGQCYENGLGIDVDYEKAFNFYKKAAEKGNAYALCNIGVCYLKKHGVPKDMEKAVDYFKQSAEKDNPRALCNLGIFYANGYGVEQNDKMAFDLIKKSADLGDKIAMKQLADLYEKGRGVNQNSELAKEYNLKAFELEKNQSDF